MFSNRLGWGLEENELWQELSRMRRSGERCLDLTESNPTRVGFDYPEAEILESLARAESISYEPSPRGLRIARASVSDYYAERKASVDPDDIVLTASTSEAYSLLFKLLCNPGDRVLVPQPSYPLFDFLTSLDAVEPVPYPLTFDDSWRIDFDILAQNAEGARAIIAVHPNNPTGSFVSPGERERLAALAAKHEMALIVDEVFLDYGSGSARSFAGEKQGLSFVLSGLSKLAGLPQLKLAWMSVAGDEGLRARALERLDHISDSYLSVATPVQHAAPKLLELGSAIREQIRRRVQANVRTLERAVGEIPAVSLLPLEGGWNATIRLPAIMGSEAWALEILRQASVYLHPGAFFGFPPNAFVVVSLIPPVGGFAEAIGGVLRVVRDRVDSSRA